MEVKNTFRSIDDCIRHDAIRQTFSPPKGNGKRGCKLGSVPPYDKTESRHNCLCPNLQFRIWVLVDLVDPPSVGRRSKLSSYRLLIHTTVNMRVHVLTVEATFRNLMGQQALR